MLGKLIKYDIRSTWRDFAGLYLAILLGSVFLPLLFVYINNAAVSVIAGIAIVGIVIATLVFMIIMLFRIFNTNVFSKEGYLTMTLPVRGAEIVSSKLIVSTMWIVLTGIVSIAGLCVFIWSVAPVADILPAFRKALSLIGGREALAILLTILVIVATIVKETAKLFLACSIAHLKQLGRFRIPLGILSFFVLSWLETLLLKAVAEMAGLIPGFNDYFTQLEVQLKLITSPLELGRYIGVYNGAMAAGIFFAIAMTVVFSIGTVWLLNHKLELD